MKCSDFCLKCVKLDKTDIEKLFWDYYRKKNIFKTVLYGFEFLNSDFPAYSKNHIMNQLQYLFNERKYGHLCSTIGTMEPWTRQEEINYLYLYYFLIEINKKRITLENLHNLKPREFEVFIYNIFKDLGYTEVELTNFTKDGGFDISAKKDGLLILGECKRNGPKNIIRVGDISRLADAIGRKRAQKGIFITTSSFTKDCFREQKERDIEIEFWDGIYLIKLIRTELNIVFFKYNN